MRATDSLVAPMWYVLAAACALDLVFGDPPNALHPVAWLGTCASRMVGRLPRGGPSAAFVAGIALVISLLVVAWAFAGLTVLGALALHPVAGALVSVWVLKSTFSLRGLLGAAVALKRAHATDGLEAARTRLGWLCSRDASELDASGLANGTIESLAENLSDSVVAPLIAYAMFGLAGAVGYRVINTLDAMVGYRGEFEWLGKATARLDDALNLVPARVSAWLLLAVGALCRTSPARGLAVYRRDRALTESPNAGHPIAMIAGLLGLRLDKPGVYVIGSELSSPVTADIRQAVRLVGVAGVAAMVLTVATVWARG